tara:strand:- start:323 stop:1519 length:1197 start_codon:yes stop_codon:yes gene_type:complete
MAVYKIFPTQDTTLYSYYPSMNTGLDAICEVSNELNPLVAGETPMVARYLTQFSTDEIKNIINDKIGNKEFNVFLKNFISEAQGLNQTTTLEIRPIAQEWNNGTGHYLDNPEVDNGSSWGWRNYSGSGPWSMTGSYNGWNWTGSYNSLYAVSGGGNWFLDDGNSSFVAFGYVIPGYVQGSNLNLQSTSQSFALRDPKDIEVPVKPIVDVWNNDSIPNNGFIVKLSGSAEFNTSKYNQPILKYYSVDTNTIYPPQLEFRWKDYTSSISPTSSLIINSSDIKLSLSENPQEFNQEAVNRFYVNISPLYPTRVFQTSSLYTGLNYLPTASYYAVKDLDTNEYVINFDTKYTQISADAKGNYFDIYMNGLEPERYYSVLIKTEINGSTLIIDDNNYFKVING